MTISSLQTLWDSNSRIGEIVWLSGAAPGEMGESDLLDDLLDDLADEETLFHPSMQWVTECPEDVRDDIDEFHQWMIDEGRTGFILVGETQVPHFKGDDTTMWEQSWGNYFTKMIYVDKLEDAPALVAEWAAERHITMAEKHLARVAAQRVALAEAQQATEYYEAADVTTIEDEGRAVYE